MLAFNNEIYSLHKVQIRLQHPHPEPETSFMHDNDNIVIVANAQMKVPEFCAVIKKIGINPYVDVPKSVSDYFGQRGYAAVKGFLNGFSIRSTLVPSKSGLYRLYINGDMRKQAGVDVGDEIRLTLELDIEPRVFPMPQKLKKELEMNANAKAAWNNLSPSKQNEILKYLN